MKPFYIGPTTRRKERLKRELVALFWVALVSLSLFAIALKILGW